MKKIKQISKGIQIQVDKGNFVMAIKELSMSENISFEEAKLRIDAYEESKIAKSKKVSIFKKLTGSK